MNRAGELVGKVAIVTGGAHGIGAATSRALARAGATVVVVDLDEASAYQTADAIGGLSFAADVSDFDANRRMVEYAVGELGRLDLVHLNAGVVSGMDSIDAFSVERYRRIVGVNLDGVVFGTYASLEQLERTKGAIVATSSLAGLTATPAEPLYSATKHAVVGLARAYGPALADRGIRYNAVCPGVADTQMAAQVRDTLDPAVPVMAAEEVAEVVLELFTGDMSGECWFVQPGRHGSFGFRRIPGPRVVS
jgi:NAD(P)-dependent dehydrogenase (short-subunit alcohol dehydrogenase family)